MICIIAHQRHTKMIVEKTGVEHVSNSCARNQFNFYQTEGGFIRYGESPCIDGIYMTTEDAFNKIAEFCPTWSGSSEKQDEIVMEFLQGLKDEMLKISS